MRSFLRSNKTALLFSLLYLLPAIVWVLFSDNWLFNTFSATGEHQIKRLDTIKDLGFVFGISLMVFFMIRFSRQKLNETKLQYQNLFNRHPNPMWIYEADTLKFLAVNNAAIEHYGYSEKEFLNMSMGDIRPAEEIPKVLEFVAAMEKGIQYSHKWKHRKKNGEIIIIEATANNVEFQKKQCWLISIIDITERDKKDEEIRKLSLIAANATNAMLILDKEARIEWVSRSFTEQTGYAFNESIGKRPEDFLHGQDTDGEILTEIVRSTRKGLPFTGEILNYRKDGSSLWVRLNISPVLTNGEITNFVAIQTDITAIKWQNDHLRDIAFTASHRFRKPLANIMGLINVLQLNSDVQQELTYLKQSAEELDEEVRHLVEKTTLVLAARDNK